MGEGREDRQKHSKGKKNSNFQWNVDKRRVVWQKKAMAILHRVTNKKERDCNPQKRIWRRRWDRGVDYSLCWQTEGCRGEAEEDYSLLIFSVRDSGKRESLKQS